jgi:uncharacterized membrane protein YhaH (DUF805 family)
MYENSFTLKNMLAAYRKPLQFKGRSTRTELLGYFIMSWLISTVIGWLAIGSGLALSVDQPPLMTFDILNFVLWLPFPALAVRRFHDQDKPGWWATPLILSTVISWIGGFSILNQPARIFLSLIYLAMFILLFLKPTDGTNGFGPNPRLDPDEAELAAE